MRSFISPFSSKFIPLAALVVLLGGFQTSGFPGVKPYSRKTCGVLYTEARGKGSKIIVGEQSVNIPGVHWTSQSCKKLNTGSLKIARGCQMRMCNATNLGGSCELLEPGRYSGSKLSRVFGGEIVSISCECSKKCKCSDIFMKKRSCARAYVEGGCKTCHSLYFELTGSETYFPEEYIGKVKALRLRKGCNLTLYSEEEYEGHEEFFDDEIVEDYNGEFISYKCLCNDDEYVAKMKARRPASSPSLIDIPSNEGDVTEMLKNNTYANHPGLLAAFKTYKNGRSSRNTYILLLGTVGSGKSSTIDLLFDNYVTTTNDLFCGERGIREFRIPTPVDEWGIANSELRIIETPGVGDTRGLEQDAKSLANLDNFLSTHEDLKDRVPNVVLIFHKFRDNAFRGAGTHFIKMLRAYDSLRGRITDENFSNVIFVFTHLCSETKANRRNPSLRLNGLKNVIERYTQFPRPTIMTVAENKGKDQELPMVDGHYKFPNGEFYPKNLIEKMELVTKNAEDLVGLGVIQSAFEAEHYNMTSSEYPIYKTVDIKAEKYLTILSNYSSFSDIPVLVENTQPVFPDNLVVGYGYSLFNDATLSTSPFLQQNLQQSDIGFMIPNIVTAQPSRSSKSNFFVFGNQSEYIEHRLQSLGLEGNIPVENFNGTLKSGHNMKTGFMKNDSCSLSFTREFHLFQFSLNNSAAFTPQFYETVASLPVYKMDCQETVDAWRVFLKKYGTHIVNSGNLGGAIEIGIRSNSACNENFIQALMDIMYFVEDMPFLVTGESRNSQKTLLRQGYSYSISFLGGSSQFYLSNSTEMSVEQAALLLGKWKESLKTNPVVLPSTLKLVPLSKVVRKIGSVLSTEAEKAIFHLFKSSVKHVSQNDGKRNAEAGADSGDEALVMIGESLSAMRKSIGKLLSDIHRP